MEGAGIVAVPVGSLPLVDAIDHRLPPSAIQKVVRLRPGEIEKVDLEQQNEYPLHRAIRLGLAPDAIKFLARHHLPALRHRAYSQGWLPLHLAARHSSAAVVREVLEAWPGALMEKTTENGDLPLHLTFGHSPDEMAVVQLLAAEGPQALREVNNMGLLPLHLAAAASTDQVVEFLTVEWDGALQRPTSSMGHLPLHLAATVRAKNGLDPTGVIRFFAATWSPALLAPDKKGGLPIHHAASFAPLPAVRALAESSQHSLQTKTNQGALPLHLAACNEYDLEAVVTYLADRFPPALQATDLNGCLPIHYAASRVHQKEAVQVYAKLWPEGLQRRTNNGYFPLQMAVHKGAPLESVQNLLVAFPEAVLSKDQNGRTTLQLAQKFKAPPDVVRFLANNGPSRWLVQFLEDDGSPTLQLRVAQYFAKLATSQQRDVVVESGAIAHLVRLQSSPVYKIREQAVRALVAGAKASTRYREAFQEAQRARKLEMQQQQQRQQQQQQQQRENDSAESVPPGVSPAALRPAESTCSSNGPRSTSHAPATISQLHDEKQTGKVRPALREAADNKEAANIRDKSPLPPHRNLKAPDGPAEEGRLADDDDVSDTGQEETAAPSADLWIFWATMSLGLPTKGYIATEESVEETLQSPTKLLEIVKVVLGLLVEDTDQQDRPMIRKVIESGIVSKFYEFLTWDESPDLQIEVARVITEVAMGPAEQTEACVLESGAIPALGGLLLGSSRHEAVRKHAALALGNIALCCPLCRDLILEAGVVGPIVELLDDEVVVAGNNNRPLLRWTTWALACVCSNGPDFHRIRPALPVLEKLLHHHDRKVVEEACWTFADLTFSFDDNIVQATIDAGPSVAARLVELLGSPRPRLQLSALCTLANIVAGNAHQVDSVVGLQVLPVVADLLLSSRFPSIRTEACRLVTNVASEGVTHVQAVVSCTKLVAALLSALSETETIEVRAEAAKAVGAAASSGSPEQISLLVDAGFVGPMCDMLLVRWGGENDDDEDGDDTIIYILEGLEMILYVGEVQSRSCGGGGNNRMASKLVDAGGDFKIRNLQRRSSDCSGEVQERVSAILETYFDTETAVVGNDEAAAATL